MVANENEGLPTFVSKRPLTSGLKDVTATLALQKSKGFLRASRADMNSWHGSH